MDATPKAKLCTETMNFTNYLTDIERTCQWKNGLNKCQPYFTWTDLHSYWDSAKIQKLLRSHDMISYRTDHIRPRFLRIFSLLVFTGTLECLPIFLTQSLTDDHFGRDDLSRHLFQPAYKSLSEAILKYQWQFFPIVIDQPLPALLPHSRLSPNSILPCDSETEISRSGLVVVFKMTIRSSYERDSKTKEYVRKAYSVGAESQYRAEHDLLSQLHFPSPNHHIVQFYGSFIRGGISNLILEYVPGGTLMEYLHNTVPPSTPQEQKIFFNSIWKIFLGLDGIHRLRNRMIGVHQDLTPSNILRRYRDGDSCYDFDPVLIDFGLSSVRTISLNQREDTMPDHHGNQQFAAPEASHHAEHTYCGQNSITQAIDMWSAGCILSIAAVWVMMGMNGVHQYEQDRIKEAKNIENFKHGAPTGCFHNGNGLLFTVKQMHNRVKTSYPQTSCIALTIKLIEEYCLLETAVDRSSARGLYEKYMSSQIQPESVPERQIPIPVEPLSSCTLEVMEPESFEQPAIGRNEQDNAETGQTSLILSQNLATNILAPNAWKPRRERSQLDEMRSIISKQKRDKNLQRIKKHSRIRKRPSDGSPDKPDRL